MFKPGFADNKPSLAVDPKEANLSTVDRNCTTYARENLLEDPPPLESTVIFVA